MRKALDRLNMYPDHRGLAYDVRAPIDDDSGKVNQQLAGKWLDAICKPGIPTGYAQAVERWQASFRQGRDVVFEVRTEGRLLIGHGNPAPTDVGITLHHTWGVPVLPGSALKGLTAHFVATCYGADPDERAPEREPFVGPGHDDGRRAGDIYRRLFGVSAMREPGGDLLPAYQGEVVFHDALWLPRGSGPWLARDVLTVHQRTYYQGRDSLPNDYDDPNPVAFLSVPSGVGFLVALSCDDGTLLQMAERFVGEALGEWGIGGKTAAGYGRMSVHERKRLEPPDGSPALEEFEGWLQSNKQVKQGEQLERIEREWLVRLQSLAPAEQERVARLLTKQIQNQKKRAQRDALLRKIRGR